MSRENVELIRRAIDGFNAGDLSATRERLHPDAVMHHLEGWPEPGPSVGREAVIREFEQLREVQPVQTVDMLDFVEAGNRVAARFAWRGSGRGPDTEMEFTFVYTFHEGKVVFQQNFWDHDEALEAVGLAE